MCAEYPRDCLISNYLDTLKALGRGQISAHMDMNVLLFRLFLNAFC